MHHHQKPFRIHNYPAFTEKHFNFFPVVLACSEFGKQTRISGKAAAIKHAFCKEYNSRTLQVAVRKVLQDS
jgi:hypothetical protein